MPRIRTIKPETWTDRKFVKLTPYARLFFIGMWNFALCDDGHIEGDDFQLRLKILPADNVDAAEIIEELVTSGLVARLPEIDGEEYLHVVGLRKHQKTDSRWTPRCPVCSHQSPTGPAETHASLDEPHRDSPELRGDSPQEGKGKERKGKEEDKEPGPADADPADTPRPDVEEICQHLADRITANGSRPKTITKAWRDAARLILDRDGYTTQQVHWIIDWSQDSTFWRANIMSMPKLREKFDTLKLQALAEAKPAPSKRQQEVEAFLAGTTPTVLEVTQ